MKTQKQEQKQKRSVAGTWRKAAPTIAAAVAVSFTVVSCDRSVREITDVQELSDPERLVKLDATSEERFGRDSPHSPHGETAGGAAPAENPLRWETPEGWTELASSRMRVINLTFGPNGEGECYLTILPGAGGGTVANINRWRSQMGQEPLSEEEIGALPKKPLLGQPAPFVSIDGTYSGMGNREPGENYRMQGLILADEQMTFFVKMIGPADLVEKEAEKFDQFAESVRIVTQG